ncbi:MAG: sulfate ABC transporter permease [Vulcanimicrobiaceae bacterium]
MAEAVTPVFREAVEPVEGLQRPVLRSSRRPRGVEAVAIGLAVLCVVGLVVLPLACVFAEALRDGLGGFSAVFSDDYARSAIALTLEIAAITVVANTLFGILAAWTIAKYRFPGKALLLSAIDLPLSVSPVVAGLAILLTVGVHSPLGAWLVGHGLRIAFAPPGIALATIFVTFPYVARELAAFLQEQGRQLEEAALGLGASLWQTLTHVTLPNARWALLNGILLCNARAMGEFGAVSVISGRIRGLTDTVPLHIEILYDEDAFSAAFALAATLACVTVALTLLRSWIERRTGLHHIVE